MSRSSGSVVLLPRVAKADMGLLASDDLVGRVCTDAEDRADGTFEADELEAVFW
jgi:hypothetical protein